MEEVFCKDYIEKKTKEVNTDKLLKKRDWLIQELDKLELPQTLPKGIIHGDLNETNVFF